MGEHGADILGTSHLLILHDHSFLRKGVCLENILSIWLLFIPFPTSTLYQASTTRFLQSRQGRVISNFQVTSVFCFNHPIPHSHSKSKPFNCLQSLHGCSLLRSYNYQFASCVLFELYWPLSWSLVVLGMPLPPGPLHYLYFYLQTIYPKHLKDLYPYLLQI